MKMIVPFAIGAGEIVSTNVPDPNPTDEWVAAADYIVGEQKYHLNVVYEALTNHTGLSTVPSLDLANWVRVGSINKLCMFDGVLGRATTNPESIEAVVRFPDRVVNGAAFFGLKGSDLQVQVTDTVEGVVYSREVNLRDNSAVTDWWSWFFEPILQKEDVVLDDMPSYIGAEVSIAVIASEGSDAACGESVFGVQRSLGLANFGSSVETEDFSVRNQDQFGNVSIIERGFVKIADFDVSYDSSRLHSIQRALAEVRAKPVVFIGDSRREELIVYGLVERFVLVLEGPKLSSGTLRVKGIV